MPLIILILYFQVLESTAVMDPTFFNETNTTGPANTSVSTTLEGSKFLDDSDWRHIQDGFYVAGYIITPTILIIGVFGNTMTLLTVTSKSFANLTSRYILVALALSDTMLIVLQPLNKLFVRDLIGFDIRAYSDNGCKLFFWLFRTSKMTSSWLIVIMCFERFVAVVFPLQTKKIINKKIILLLILSDYLVIGTYNALWSFSSLIEDGICKPDVVFPDTKIKYRDFLVTGISLFTFIPMTFMGFFTPVIIWKLIKKRQKRRTTQRMGGKVSSKDSKEIKASVVLVAVVAAFTFLVLPIAVMFYIAFWRSFSAFEVNDLPFFICREVAQILEQVNYSINFFLYILCSEMFRKKALQLLQGPFQRNKISPSSHNTGNNSASNDIAVSNNSLMDNTLLTKVRYTNTKHIPLTVVSI